MNTADPLVVVDHVSKAFSSGRALGGSRELVMAVNDVSLTISAGETVALVGESGSGKSSLARLVLGLQPVTSGSVRWNGTPLTTMTRSQQLEFRRSAQIVFQNPAGALNPKKRIAKILAQPLQLHYGLRGRALRERVAELLHVVGLRPAEEFMSRFPNELSGGQRQRVVIARAISLESKLVVLDEPLASLDVSIQVQILRLLADLQERYGLAYLLITHHLGTARSVSDRILVMYLGKIVEEGPTEDVFTNPRHPYTQALLAAVPSPNPRDGDQFLAAPPLAEDPPAVETEEPTQPDPSALAVDVHAGCRFRSRCAHAFTPCHTIDPPATMIDVARNHTAACHLHTVPAR